MSTTKTITEEDVLKVAMLARLKLEADDLAQHIGNLNNILGVIDQLSTVNTDTIEPMYSSLATALALREDVVTEENQRDLLQKLTNQVESGLYLVPQVLE